jgi:hypothetical protein
VPEARTERAQIDSRDQYDSNAICRAAKRRVLHEAIKECG